MNLELEGRRAIVTGGSRGIGLAVARALAVEGARVALVARGVEALDEAAHALSALASATGSPVAASGAERDPHVIAVSADTGSDDSVAAMVARVVDEFGGVDILVNAAATPNTGGIPECSLGQQPTATVQRGL